MWVLEKAMAPHSSTLAWKIPWMEEPGRLQSMGLLRVGHDWATSLSLFIFMHWRRKWQPTPVFLPGESQGWGAWWLPSMGLHRVRHDWSDLAVVWVYFWALYVCVSHSAMSDCLQPHILGPIRLLCPWNSPARILEWVAIRFSMDFSDPEIEPRSLSLQIDSCFPGGTSGKEPACQCRRCNRCWFNPWIRNIPWRRTW